MLHSSTRSHIVLLFIILYYYQLIISIKLPGKSFFSKKQLIPLCFFDLSVDANRTNPLDSKPFVVHDFVPLII